MNQQQILKYARFGMAAMRPGMIHLRDLMDEAINDLEQTMQSIDSVHVNENGKGHARRGRPPKEITVAPEAKMLGPVFRAERARRAARARWAERKGAGKKTERTPYAGAKQWAKLTPEERSVEMKRRMAVAKARKEAEAAALEEKRKAKGAKLSAIRKAAWAKLSKAERAEKMRALRAGYARKRAEAA